MKNEADGDDSDVQLRTDERARFMEQQSLLYRRQQALQQQQDDVDEKEIDDFLFKLAQEQMQTSHFMQCLMIIGIIFVPIFATLLVQLLSSAFT